MKKILQILLLLIIGYFTHAQTLVRGPYLTMATQNSIVITWRTDIACNSKVKYGQNVGAYSGGTVNNNLVTEHIIKLSGLVPGTKYYYTVGTANTVLQGNAENYFKTFPVSAASYNKPIRMLALGDVAKATIYEEKVRDAFINYVDTNYIDGYLMLGDNSYPNGQDQEYQHGFFNYFQNTITKHTVLWPALGNHEYANNYTLRQTHNIPYFDIFTLPTQAECGGIASNTEMYYSFNIGNVHFVNLDSYGLEEVGGFYYGITDTALAPQINWLKQDLNANSLPWVIISFHHPPYCMGTHNSDLESDLVAIREKLNPIFERYNVDLILNGHCHTYQRSGMMHHHLGMETTYDTALHRVQHSNGRDDATMFSCAYIKNSNPPRATDSGLIYMVIGSGSDYPITPQTTWPHNAMSYSNYNDNGSLLLTITDNQLIAEWISTDTNQIVKDRFTMYKNVNRKKHMTVASGQSITLNASWNKNNDYVWSNGDSTQQINIVVTAPQVVSVTDKKGCIVDSFFIDIAPLSISEEIKEKEIIVSPNPVHDELKISGLEVGTYTLTLINSKGSTIIQKEIEIKRLGIPYLLSVEHIADGQYFLSIKKRGMNVVNYQIEKIAK